MNKYRIFFLVLIPSILISSCSGKASTAPVSTNTEEPTNTLAPQATFTPACISTEPAPDDINRATTFTGDLFADWQTGNTLTGNHVTISWINADEGASAYIDVLIFQCGYEDLDLDKYFNDSVWKTVFLNYQSYKQLGDMCQTNDGLRLYEFSLNNQGYPYNARYWVMNDTDTRVIALMLACPSTSMAVMDEYAIKLFPKLPNCS